MGVLACYLVNINITVPKSDSAEIITPALGPITEALTFVLLGSTIITSF
jgi:hypothetical protein